MKNKALLLFGQPAIRLSIAIWLRANLAIILLASFAIMLVGTQAIILVIFPFAFAAAIGSMPIGLLIAIILPFINRQPIDAGGKRKYLYAVIFCALALYGFFAALLGTLILNSGAINWQDLVTIWAIATAGLSLAGFTALFFSDQAILIFFNPGQILHHNKSKIHTIMEHQTDHPQQAQPVKSSNTILFKGIITGFLILVMMIPSVFIYNLVQERKQRQQSIVEEVSSKWANAQTIGGFYISVPYEVQDKDEKGNPVLLKEELIIFPENQLVNASLSPEIRPRSIYKVLLYKSQIQFSGQYAISSTANLDPLSLKWNEAKICLGISDIKGIDERVVVVLNGKSFELSPGLPSSKLFKTGLSAPAELQVPNEKQALDFNCKLQIRGSEKLHFLPFAGNSQFTIRSNWNSPSFDGNYLPGSRTVSDSGFQSSWAFNKANLPFGTQLKEVGFEPANFSFGVTMLQPSDQYAKTERSVKYAILFIGLTFSLFFIIELLQKNPVHPVQYVLIGIALSIFYTLLLSISEFLAFDLAYLIAALATVLLITLYAKGHFRSWKTGAIFGSLLSVLYGFTFVLVRLEDTALLIGSIGLFIVLSLVMYASRKINWYGSPSFAS